MNILEILFFIISPFVDISYIANKETPLLIRICAWISIICATISISYYLWYGINPLRGQS